MRPKFFGAKCYLWTARRLGFQSQLGQPWFELIGWPTPRNVSPIAERVGNLPGYEVIGWFGLLASAGTSLHVDNRLGGLPQKAFADKQFRQRIYDQGAEPISGSYEELKISIAAEYHRWGKLIRAVGIKAE
jgi:hypothetical protein